MATWNVRLNFQTIISLKKASYWSQINIQIVHMITMCMFLKITTPLPVVILFYRFAVDFLNV